MALDFAEQVRSDHDDLDQKLALLVSATTPVADLAGLFEAMRVALVVHVTAEARVLERLLLRASAPALRSIVQLTRREHGDHQTRVDALAKLRAGSCEWYERVIELRSVVLDHAWHARVSRSLITHVSQRALDAAAQDYAAERLRVCNETFSASALAHLRIANA